MTRAGGADSKVDVLVVGSVNRDHVCRVEALPAAGETVLGGEASAGPGGKGGNQAVAASLFGARTALVARVGDDSDGHALTAALAEAGVDTTEVAATGVPTGTAFVFVDARGENSIVVAPGANDLLDPASVDHAVRHRLAASGVLVTQAEIPVPAFEGAVRIAAEVGCRAVVNLAPYRPVDEAVLALCDPLVVNESEVSCLLGRQVRRASGARDAAGDLLRLCRSVVVTVGGEGAVVADGDGVQVLAAPQARVVDSTGAGDAFIGAMAAALSAGHDLPSAVRIAVRAGAYAVTRPGAQASFASAAELGIARSRRTQPRGVRRAPTSADSVDSRREEHNMDQDVDLLAQRVEKHRAKLEEEVTLLGMTEKRVAAAESDRQSTSREAERLKSRAKQAKRDARRLSSEAKRAQVRLEAIDSDHAQAVKEAKSRSKTVAKRQQKLAEAEGAHAAAKAETSSAARPPSTRRKASSSPTSAAKKTATPRKRAASSSTRKRTTKATTRPSTTKKTS